MGNSFFTNLSTKICSKLSFVDTKFKYEISVNIHNVSVPFKALLYLVTPVNTNSDKANKLRRSTVP